LLAVLINVKTFLDFVAALGDSGLNAMNLPTFTHRRGRVRDYIPSRAVLRQIPSLSVNFKPDEKTVSIVSGCS